MNAASLCLVDVEPERAGLHGVLAARLQDQTDRRSRQAVQNSAAERHEAESDPVVDLVVDRDDVGDRQADLAAGQPRRYDDEVLQHQNRNQSGEAEVGTAHPQRRQRQHDAARHGRERARRHAEENRRLIQIVEDAGGVGAEPDQECGAEIHLVGEAEQQVPGHREHAKIIGDGEQAEDVAGDVQRQRRGDEHDDQADPDRGRAENADEHGASGPSRRSLLPPCGRRWREAPDEGRRNARDPSPQPSPARGEGARDDAGITASPAGRVGARTLRRPAAAARGSPDRPATRDRR